MESTFLLLTQAVSLLLADMFLLASDWLSQVQGQMGPDARSERWRHGMFLLHVKYPDKWFELGYHSCSSDTNILV